MHWTKYFKSHIIERGQDYFDMDVVEIRYIDSDSIDTTVYGNEAYDVEINDIGTDDMTMMCDCPHAMDQNFCKHMAATMIMFEDLNGEVPANRAKKSKKKSSLEHTFYHDLKRSLRMYERFLNKIAADASDRKRYRELMGYLKEIKEMQGDEEIAERLERQWRLLYKNRPAMMDELNKVMGKKGASL
ncbi:SWIM zinc finger family protein [Macrococcus animalis]|uniref:SWIM zinc finger family protein n=1 Tax=Macrococcus animalis TaxID=3395467 RepID=UPI0039BDABAF